MPRARLSSDWAAMAEVNQGQMLSMAGLNLESTLFLVGNPTVGKQIFEQAHGAGRYPGFRLGFMPGTLPRLMGVLLLDRFALGPSALSDLAGFAYHFWNGASFGIVFVMLALGRSSWWAVPYGTAVGLGFLASPVVVAIGVGPFGRDFGWHFAATVLTAHVLYGLALAALMRGRGAGDRLQAHSMDEPPAALRTAPVTK